MPESVGYLRSVAQAVPLHIDFAQAHHLAARKDSKKGSSAVVGHVIGSEPQASEGVVFIVRKGARERLDRFVAEHAITQVEAQERRPLGHPLQEPRGHGAGAIAAAVGC